MGLFDHFPYTNIHELNLSWLLRLMEELSNKVDNFVALNTIKYADPIQWNITSQYEANTVVVDPQSGTAYISSRPVPAGVALTNTDYWSVIFTLDMISANDNITFRDDGSNVLSTFTSNEGDWLLWNGDLYRVSQNINLNEAYVVGYNLTRYTVELFIKDYVDALNTVIADLDDKVGDLDDLNTTNKSSIVNAINSEMADRIKYANNHYITPQQFGAAADGVTDDYQAFKDAVNYLYTNAGGILFIPNGKYIVSNTIPVPDNVSVIGESFDAEVYFDGTHPYMGTTFVTCGSNITFENFKVSYYEADTSKFTRGTQLGGIGITNVRFVADADIEDMPTNIDIANIVCRNIYSENTSPLQVEVGSGGSVTNVQYINCIAPLGQIRMSPDSAGDLNGGIIKGCHCKAIAIGYNAKTNVFINIDNCITGALILLDKNIYVTNTLVKAKLIEYHTGDSPLDRAVTILGDNLHFDNVQIINPDSIAAVGYGIRQRTDDTYAGLYFNNVYVDGFTVPYAATHGVEGVFVGCNFINSASVYGQAIGCSINNSNLIADYYSDNEAIDGTITAGSSVSLASIISVTKLGYSGLMVINGTSTSYNPNDVFATISDNCKPRNEQIILGCAYNSGSAYPLRFKLTTSGELTLASTFSATVPSGARFIIDAPYNI